MAHVPRIVPVTPWESVLLMNPWGRNWATKLPPPSNVIVSFMYPRCRASCPRFLRRNLVPGPVWPACRKKRPRPTPAIGRAVKSGSPVSWESFLIGSCFSPLFFHLHHSNSVHLLPNENFCFESSCWDVRQLRTRLMRATLRSETV